MKQSTIIRNTMQKRQTELKEMIHKVQREMQHSPKGTLRIQHNNGVPQYYWREDKQDRKGRYLKKSELSIAEALAQKSYNEKLISAAERECLAIQCFLDSYPSVSSEDVFEQFNDDRKKMIKPIYEPDDIFLQKWLAVEYPKKPVEEDTIWETDNGEIVRSKSELIIANTLKRLGIPYRYEYPLKLKGSSELVHPDFYILNVRLRKVYIFEHFGRIDSLRYSENMIRRIRLYAANGIYQGDNFVFTFETKDLQLSTRDVERIAKHYFL